MRSIDHLLSVLGMAALLGYFVGYVATTWKQRSRATWGIAAALAGLLVPLGGPLLVLALLACMPRMGPPPSS